MSEILIQTESLFTTDERFIVDNMLTEEDLDLDPEFWAELSSNDSNSCDLNQVQSSLTTDSSVYSPISLSAPETPPSSDRSTPPNFDDLSHNILTQTTNILPNVTIFPAINICPMSPMSPIIANASPFVAIKTQNVLNENFNYTTIGRNTDAVGKQLNACQQRREARKIRNREAATTSRIRKKEYLESLEGRIDGLIKENVDLKNENLRLMSKIIDLENRNNCLAKRSFNGSECKCRTLLTSNGGSNKKAALSLLAVVFMLGLNLAPFSGVLISNEDRLSGIESNPRRDSQPKHGGGRSLLWDKEDKRVDIDIIAFNSSRINNSSVNCKTYVNQTESLRLESDLRVWLSKVKLEKEEVFKYKKQLKANSNKQIKKGFNKPIPLPRLKAWIKKRTETDFNEFNDYPIESYKTGLRIPQINYEDLLSAIPRRDDTFYLLSYSSKDHLIIPPMNRSSSAVRPRFSLLIPLISTLNESLIRGTNVTYSQMSVMQIDCQVINTKMVLFNTQSNKRTDRTIADPNVLRNTSTPSKSKNRTSILSKNPKRS